MNRPSTKNALVGCHGLSARQVITRVLVETDTKYDCEGNHYEIERDIEVVSIVENNKILWHGTIEEANGRCGHIKSLWLPYINTCRRKTAQYALWTFVAPFAIQVFGKPKMVFERTISQIRAINSPSSHYVKGITRSYLHIKNATSMVEHAEWLLVTGENIRILCNVCYLESSDGIRDVYIIGKHSEQEQL